MSCCQSQECCVCVRFITIYIIISLLFLNCFTYLTLCCSKRDLSVKVVRVCLDDGERLIGVQYADVLLPLAEREARTVAEEKKVDIVGTLALIL